MPLRFVLSAALLTLASGAASAQPDGAVRLYGELLGNGGAGSANAEVRATRTLAVRGGLGFMPGWPETTRNAVSAPLMLVWLPGGESGVELGVGATVRYRIGGEGINDRPGFTDTFPTATIGYRWVTRGGALFRVGLTPLYGQPEGNPDVQEIVPLIGASAGVAL